MFGVFSRLLHCTYDMDDRSGNDKLDDSVQRYCSQYLQLESSPELPAAHLLREAPVQDAIFNRLFKENSVRYGPPVRYQLKMLKELVSRIEASIEDWDAHVSGQVEGCLLTSSQPVDVCLTASVGGIRGPHVGTWCPNGEPRTIGNGECPAEVVRELPPVFAGQG